MNVVEKISRFIQEASKQTWTANMWLEDDLLSVYVRKSPRRIQSARHWFLDIANITVFKESQGTFSKWFIPQVIALKPWDGIFVENVSDERFANWFRRNGWQETTDGYSWSFYQLTPTK